MIRQQQWFHLSIIILVTVTAYGNTLMNDFAWDDIVVIVRNSALHGSALSLFKGIDNTNALVITPYYRPLTLLSFMLEQRIHGLSPQLMHLFNLLLHAMATLLVYFLAWRITEDRHRSFLAAILCAVHPINSEAVAFLSGGRNTLLSACFALSSYLIQQHAIKLKHHLLSFIASVLFLIALLSKETTLALLPFIMTLEVSAYKKMSIHWRDTLVRLLPYGAACSIYLWLRLQSPVYISSTTEIFTGLLPRLWNNIYIIPRYLATIVWPPASCMRYYIPNSLYLLLPQLITVWCTIFVALWWLFTRGRSYPTLFGLAWLAAFWLPTSGIIPFPSAPMADRYLYLPAIGLWLIVADQSVRFFPTGYLVRRIGFVILTLLLTTLAGMTIMRNRVWNNDITLFSDYVNTYPEEAFGHHNLGTAYLDLEKNLVKAEREFEKVLAIDPWFPRTQTQI